VLAVVAAWIVAGGSLPGDLAATRATTELAGTALDRPMRVAGWAGSAWLLVPVAIGLALGCAVRRAWGALVVVAGTAALVWLLNPVLKGAFTRDRPDVRDLVEPTSRWSFPSGHAVASAAFATLVVLLAWPTRGRRPVLAGAIAFVLVVGASRLVLGVHFPSDLVAGWALGIAVVTALGAWILVPPPATRSDCAP
jgi:membrane-associated phospholipid phosphatase